MSEEPNMSEDTLEIKALLEKVLFDTGVLAGERDELRKLLKELDAGPGSAVRLIIEAQADRDAARETVRRFKEAIELLCNRRTIYDEKYCAGCSIQQLCDIAKEA